jgi:hypothetical protein
MVKISLSLYMPVEVNTYKHKSLDPYSPYEHLLEKMYGNQP